MTRRPNPYPGVRKNIVKGRIYWKFDLSLGNWFRERAAEAQVPGSLHGLRKAGATRLSDAGASEWEIASYLAHSDTKQAAVYTKKSNRSKLADSGFAKLGNVSNLIPVLDKRRVKTDE